MVITNIILIIILILVITTSMSSESFKSYWGGSELVWNNNLHPRYSAAVDDKIYVFNPSAYNK